MSRNPKRINIAVLFVAIHVSAFSLANAASKQVSTEKVVICDEAKVQKVKIAFGRITTLSFPGVPKDILPGEAVFDFKKIKNDLAVIALRPNSKTNIVVYLQERRCAFDLVTVSSGGDDILFVRDPKERQFEVKFQ